MEYLSLELEAAARIKDIFPISNIQPAISHLLYADDIMSFATANEKSASSIREITQYIGMVAGVHISQIKSKVYFRTSCQNKNSLLQILQLQESQLPVKYL